MADGEETPDDIAIVDSSIIVGLIIGDLKPSSALRYRKALNRHRCATTPVIRQESITKLSLLCGREALAVKQFNSFTSNMVELRRTEDVIREIKIINGKCKGLKMPGKFLKDIEIAATAIVYECPVHYRRQRFPANPHARQTITPDHRKTLHGSKISKETMKAASSCVGSQQIALRRLGGAPGRC